jgi:fumarate hydratase class II
VSITRTETDTFGPIKVAADRYWGAQAQRSLGQLQDRLGEAAPAPSSARSGIVKRAAAEANMALGPLDPQSAPPSSARPTR